MSTTYPTPTFNYVTLEGNAATGQQAVPLQQLHVVSVLDYGAKGDGTTDDTAAIQNVLNTYAGKAVVFLPWSGASYMTRSLTLPSGTDMLLYGEIQALPGMTDSLIKMTSVVNCAIRGIGVIDGNKTAQTNSNLAGVAISGSTHISVSGITIRNTQAWALNVTQSTNVMLTGLYVTGSGSAPQFAAQCDSCWLTNSLFDGTNCTDYVFSFYGGVTNSGAIGNIFRNGGKGTTSSPPGIGVLSDSAQPLPCHNILIANNLTYGNGGPGVQVLGYTGNTTTGIVIANNRSYNNNQVGSGGVAGADIFMDYVQDITVTSNSISANGNSAGPYYTGIFVGSHVSSQLNITNNQIFNIGQGLGPATGGNNNAGIYLQNIADAYVGNNHIYDNQTTPSMAYSVIGGVAARSSFIGNHFGKPFNCNESADTVRANGTPGFFNFGLNSTVQTAKPQMITNSVGNPRWFFGQDGSTESGSNAGSNFEIISVADNNTSEALVFGINRATGVLFVSDAITSNNGIALWGGTSPSSKPAVTGSRGGNAALASLLTALASYGLITDSSTS